MTSASSSGSDVYIRLLTGLQKGLKKGRIHGQSFREVISKKHNLDTLLDEYVVCGGTKGNMLNMLDENYQTEDYFVKRFDQIYSTCICGKRDLCENVYITRFDPSTVTGVNKTNPILAIGNHCQQYFQTIEDMKRKRINQKNQQENQNQTQNQKNKDANEHKRRRKIEELHFDPFDSDEEFENFQISEFSPSCYFDEEARVFGGGLLSSHKRKKRRQIILDDHEEDNDEEDNDQDNDDNEDEFQSDSDSDDEDSKETSSSSSSASSSTEMTLRRLPSIVYLSDSEEEEDQDSSSDYEEENENEDEYEDENVNEAAEDEGREEEEKKLDADENKKKEMILQTKCKIAKYHRKIAKLLKTLAHLENA